MGRKSSLTDQEWAEIGKRLLSGTESTRFLAREYGTSEASVRRKFPSQRKDVKVVANQILAAEVALKSLPISSQIDALSLVDELKAICTHIAGAGKHSAASAHRLSILANQQLQRVDEVNPIASVNELQAVASLQKMANLSSEIGLNLLRANKEAVDDINRRGAEEEGIGGAVGSPEEYKTALREVLKEI